MAALLGNHTLTEADLRQFHIRLIPEFETSPSKVSPDLVIRAVVNYIRTLVNIDDINALGSEIFGSSDARIVKLKEVVEYYNSGTEDGYKKFRPLKKKKKEGIKISALASDTAQVDSESQEIYNSVTAGKKIATIVSKETDETAERLANLALGEEKDAKDIATDSMEAVAAVASNSVKPSENGKYPTKDMRKNSPIRDKPVIPVVNSEVVKTAAERHRQACMSPYLYNLLTTGEILLPVLMEEEGGDMGGIHTVYRELRRRVYGIVFNLHHVNFTKQKCDEEVKIAKRKVEEIVKKLAKVKSDSVIIKNNEPRSEREVLNEKLEIWIIGIEVEAAGIVFQFYFNYRYKMCGYTN